jgi:ribosomal protein L3
LKEYKILESSNYEGTTICVEMFEVGQAVAVTGFTIKQGTMGTMRAHGLMTHGSKSHRLQGSITSPGRVFPGKKCLDVMKKTYNKWFRNH